ncbi:MAG: pentapeptide repeat-containing protein [Cyanobacteria bacterium P01_A01_bin.123]
MASRLWRFLTTDISELFSGDVVSSSVEAAEAVFELAEVLEAEGQNVQKLAPLVNQLDSLLDALNSPLAEIVEKSLPFASIATGLLKFYLEKSKRKLTLANCVAIVSQAAYMESFKFFLKQDKALLLEIGQSTAPTQITQKTKQLANLEISDEDARKTVTDFPNSSPAKAFGQVLQVRLIQAGLGTDAAWRLTERVAWRAPRYMNEVWAASAEAVEHLGQPTFENWRQEQAKYQSIDDYLQQNIAPGPQEKVFDEENLTYCDIYVSLAVECLDRKGESIPNEPLRDLEDWVKQHLVKSKDSTMLFIQGEAGRGKSVFCRMFADWVRGHLYPAYIPILIRLRHVTVYASTLTETLSNYLQNEDFVTSDQGWLTDKSTRFLFLLDGFDELLLEGRESGGLKEFLQQVEQFQRGSHHRFVITGRPLSLQGIERVISQTDNLERLELQPMADELRERWYQKWAIQFGQPELDALKRFLSLCPWDVRNFLAREPLLLYLLGRMHREKFLSADMFENAKGIDAKVVIYDEAVRWVVKKQRQNENFRQVGLNDENLRQALTEAAVCVMQSDNEVAKVSFLEARLLQDSNNPMSKLLEDARKEVNVSEEKLLNNLLTTFYIKPASGDREGSVEFAHKSFGEFLFAERLKNALEDWSQPGKGRRKYLVPQDEMHWEIYDLLGYGGLTQDVVAYLKVLLTDYSDFEPIQLFERLHDFYLRWWEGEFINATANNFPQGKMQALREQIPDREAPLGLRQVDVVTGMNVMILLLELHRYGQSQDALKASLAFYPCGKPGTADFDKNRLSRIIGYGECLRLLGFKVVTPYLNSAYLRYAYLRYADLRSAYLRSADLRDAYLSSADLRDADLRDAYLSSANLSDADLRDADLSDADISDANLSDADLSDAYLSSAVLSDADLSDAYLSSANLRSAFLSDADLSDAYLRYADLSSANLSSANLSYANLSSANLSSANLSSANLSSANLSYANLSDADLSSANLRSANLSSANLSYADLRDADLRDANLSYANLSSANLSSANLRGAILLNTNLRNTKGLSQQQLAGENQPFICNSSLPKGIEIDKDRDCDGLAQVLLNRYPHGFKSVEQAQAFVDKQRYEV